MFQGRTILMVGLSLFMAATVHAKTEVTEFPAVPGEFIVKLKNPKLLESKSTLMAFNSTNVRIVTKESGALVRRPVRWHKSCSTKRFVRTTKNLFGQVFLSSEQVFCRPNMFFGA